MTESERKKELRQGFPLGTKKYFISDIYNKHRLKEDETKLFPKGQVKTKPRILCKIAVRNSQK